MIIEKVVSVKVNATTIKYWQDKGYTIPTHIDSKGRIKQFKRGVTRLSVKVDELPPKSNVIITAKCNKCLKKRKIQYCQYTKLCWSCNLNSQKGVNHPRYLHQVKSKTGERAFDLYLRRTYGITAQHYYKLFKNQRHMCAICKKHQSEEGRKFAVDHKHGTLVVRGLLCQSCNTAIGLFKENIKSLLTAAKYLTKVCK